MSVNIEKKISPIKFACMYGSLYIQRKLLGHTKKRGKLPLWNAQRTWKKNIDFHPGIILRERERDYVSVCE